MSALESLQRMVALQKIYNRQISPSWATDDMRFFRAIWVECAELLDHCGWKWWKHQQGDLDQARLEVVDIWHFGLSQLIVEERINAGLADLLAAPVEAVADLPDAVEVLAQHCLATRSFDPSHFKGVMNGLGMTWEQLVGGYLGKNVLNHFRRDHGYGDGTYVKNWAGREDNEHLVELVGNLDATAADFSERLMAALQARYRETGCMS